jgi:hypothetical protein
MQEDYFNQTNQKKNKFDTTKIVEQMENYLFMKFSCFLDKKNVLCEQKKTSFIYENILTESYILWAAKIEKIGKKKKFSCYLFINTTFSYNFFRAFYLSIIIKKKWI